MLIASVAVDVDRIKANDQRRITVQIGQVVSSVYSRVTPDSAPRYFLFRQDIAGSPLTLVNAGGTAMTAAGSDWEATVTFVSGNTHVIVVSAVVLGAVVGVSGVVRVEPPKVYFDPTELFS